MNNTHKINDDIRYIKLYNIMSNADPNSLNLIKKRSTLISYHKNELIFNKGDRIKSIYLLNSGLIRSEYIDRTGDLSFCSYISEQSLFPYGGLLRNNSYSYSAIAVTDLQVLEIPMIVFNNVLSSDINLSQIIIKKMGKMINDHECFIQQMLSSTARQRVFIGLTTLARQLGKKVGAYTTIPYPFSLAEIGIFCGTTRETVRQVVNQLTEMKKLTYRKKHFIFKMSLASDD